MTARDPATPLVRTLTLLDGMRVWFEAMPEHVIDEIDEYALELFFVPDPALGIDAAHIFVTDRATLEARLGALRHQIMPDGQIWVSWPASPQEAEGAITDEMIRAIAEPLGLTDTKSCQIDDDWAGLKLVIRKDLR